MLTPAMLRENTRATQTVRIFLRIFSPPLRLLPYNGLSAHSRANIPERTDLTIRVWFPVSSVVIFEKKRGGSDVWCYI
jgi:hypothetical protein